MRKVTFITGEGSLHNHYVVLQGTQEECETFIATLPDEPSASGTTPNKEQCYIEDNDPA